MVNHFHKGYILFKRYLFATNLKYSHIKNLPTNHDIALREAYKIYVKRKPTKKNAVIVLEGTN